MIKSTTAIDILNLEHDTIMRIEKEDECYTPPYHDERTQYIERQYVTEFTPRITENLRFYKRKNGKIVSIYVNPKTGKGMKSPIEQYMREVNQKLSNQIAPIRQIDIEILDHLRRHIAQKIRVNSKSTLSRLRKAKENL